MKLEQTKVYGEIAGGVMRYSYPGWMWYSEAFQIKFSCPLQFQNFPFDSNKCCLEYGELGWDSRRVMLQEAIILYENMTTADEGLITVKNLPFPYKVKIKSQPAFEKVSKLYGRAAELHFGQNDTLAGETVWPVSLWPKCPQPK